MLKNNPLINLAKQTWRYSKGSRGILILSIALSITSNLVLLAEPLVVKKIFNTVQFSPHSPDLLKNTITYLLLLIAITLGFWIFHFPSRILERKNAFLVRKNYKQIMFDKVLTLPAQWHKDHHSGDTIDKINRASQHLFSFAEASFFITENFIGLFGSVFILLFFDWKTLLLTVPFSVLIIILIIKLDIFLKKYLKKIFKEKNYLASAVHDYISNIITIITLRLENRVSKEIKYRSMRAYQPYQKNSTLSEIKWLSVSMLIIIMTTSILIINAYTSYKSTGIIVIGTLFVLYKYLEKIGIAFYQFAWQYGQMLRQDATVRAAEVINQSYEKYSKNTKKHYLPANWHSIIIKNLNFKYPKPISEKTKGNDIKNVSLNIHRGEKIAFIGQSGSGKSTILSLLRGLHQAEDVKVYCNGKKMEHGLAHLYNHTTLIPQDPEIFNSTIKDNITMGIRTNSQNLKDAINTACFNKVIKRLKNGLKTNVLEKGVSLSGGEKQRLALARGILACAKYDFILLDEPTSSVDTMNELDIYNNIFKKFPQKTIISSIHRLHLLKMFDYIYFFDNGKIIVQGTFNTLLNDSHFKKLWQKYNSKSTK